MMQYEHEPAQPLNASVGTDAEFYALAWAINSPLLSGNYSAQGEMLYVSMTGRYPLVRAAWAAIQDGRKAQIRLPWNPFGPRTYTYYCYATRAQGKGAYDCFWNESPLPYAGSYAHLVMLHTSVSRPLIGEPFFHLSPDGELPNIDHFYHQLDRALTLPLRPEWDEQLWFEGIRQQTITRLTTHNCAAWMVSVDEEKWARITTQLATHGQGEMRVEIYGDLLKKSDSPDDIEEVASEEEVD